MATFDDLLSEDPDVREGRAQAFKREERRYELALMIAPALVQGRLAVKESLMSIPELAVFIADEILAKLDKLPVPMMEIHVDGSRETT